MSNQPVQTLKGFRDIPPAEFRRRQFVAERLSAVFEQFGFEPIATPTLEYADLILGKYGDEADKLVYTFTDQGDRQVALPYDQTVPTTRFLTERQSELPRYFRRYMISNVFRADKPQKGRYREFTQCDIDIFGSADPLADAEILACSYMAFANVGFDQVVLQINDRQTLFSTLETFATDQVDVLSIIQSVDKLDKMTADEVTAELVDKGLSQDTAAAALKAITQTTISDQLATIVDAATQLGVPEESLVFTPTLARGLDYYTGMIFEVSIPKYSVGSCGAGGRYDNLIEQLGGPATPAVGMAVGFDRTVEAATQLELIPPEAIQSGAEFLVTVFDQTLMPNALATARQLRAADRSVELYPASDDRLSKQFKLADQKNIPYVIIIGPEEAEQDAVTVRDMKTGDQQTAPLATVIETY